jgi:hypothetical protein
MSNMRRSVPTLPLALCLLASSWWLTPSQSRACSILAPAPAFRGVPADGDTDVPTDVVLLYPIPFSSSSSRQGIVPGTFALTAPDGSDVAIAVNSVDYSHFELRPTLTFTTGSGVLTEQPQPPDAVLTHFVVAQDLSNACGPPKTGTCVSVADDDAWSSRAPTSSASRSGRARSTPRTARRSNYAARTLRW